MNDNKLILQIQRGNRRCADELIERYYSSIPRYCSWHCYNSDQAEDLAQETFLRVFRDIYMYEHKGSFKAYLYTIAHHLCIDENRKYITSELDKDIPIIAGSHSLCRKLYKYFPDKYISFVWTKDLVAISADYSADQFRIDLFTFCSLFLGQKGKDLIC